MLRLTSSAVGLYALGFSAAVHAAVWLTPLGHPSPSAAGDAPTETATVDVLVEPAPAPDVPAALTPPASRGTIWPQHTHAYPVPASHDWTPHDPHLVHALALPAAATAPPAAEAAPAQVAADELPSFTIAIGAATGDVHGVISPAGAAAPREHVHDDDTAVVAEQSVDAPARLVHGVSPAYPADARADGVEGDVRLELVVSASGAVESARVVRGIRGLDDAAVRAASQFRFAPATRGGRAVRVRMGWSVQFRLR